jgi:hypothetical protein
MFAKGSVESTHANVWIKQALLACLACVDDVWTFFDVKQKALHRAKSIRVS